MKDIKVGDSVTHVGGSPQPQVVIAVDPGKGTVTTSSGVCGQPNVVPATSVTISKGG